MTGRGAPGKRPGPVSNEVRLCVAASVLGRSYTLRSHAYATQGAEHTSTVRGHVGSRRHLCTIFVCVTPTIRTRNRSRLHRAPHPGSRTGTVLRESAIPFRGTGPRIRPKNSPPRPRNRGRGSTVMCRIPRRSEE